MFQVSGEAIDCAYSVQDEMDVGTALVMVPVFRRAFVAKFIILNFSTYTRMDLKYVCICIFLQMKPILNLKSCSFVSLLCIYNISTYEREKKARLLQTF